MKAVVEGLLFLVGDEGLDLKQISNLLEIDLIESKEIIDELINDYDNETRGIKIEFLGNKYKLTTRKEHKKYYEKLVIEENNKELTQAALETLAIIAYNEPITRAEIDEIRGVDSSNYVRKLLLRDLIKNIGRKDTPGRPNLYGTTDKFLDYFGLTSIEELPKLNITVEKNEEIDLFSSKYHENLDD